MRVIGRVSQQYRGLILGGCAAVSALLMGAAPMTSAQDLSNNPKYSAIVVDAQSGEVLYAARADSARYPASLTKIMTMYMVFDALARGQIKPSDQITISSRAASQAPVKVYLKAGDTIDVDTAMRLAAMYSANDMAVALAEKVGGTEERFTALMTIKAQELGMTQTRFVNANGLPDARQLSSARDLAILARAVLRDYPQYYSYFDLDSVTFRGRTYYNHNPLHGMPGVDGMKTGYTNAAGQNLVASQVKGNHRLIAVMLGAADKQQRREHVTELLNVGFEVEDRRDHGETIMVAQNEFTKAMMMDQPVVPNGPQPYTGAGARPYTLLASNDSRANAPLSDDQLRDALEGSEEANATDVDVQQASATVRAPDVVATLSRPAATVAMAPPAPVKAAPAKASTRKTVVVAAAATKPAKAGKAKKNPNAVWAIQVGAFKDKSLAADWVKNMQRKFDNALADATSQVTKSDAGWYRTRFASLTKEQAQKACSQISAKRLDCMVVKPDA